MELAQLPLDLAGLLALAAGLGWASGLRLYATLFLIGIAGRFAWVDLPAGLHLLEHPWVLGAAGFMLAVEFFADKVPLLDSLWDTVHTFIRIPAGAVLAAGAVGTVDPSLTLAASLVGGSVAAVFHAAKAGTRIIINTSPEPFTNWIASVVEDILVVTGLWLALSHPYLFLGLFLIFLMLMVWLLPKVWAGVRKVFRFLFDPFWRKGHLSEMPE